MTSPASLPSARATRDDRYLHFVCRQGEQPDVVDKARRVHAETYLHQGLVKAHAVDPLTRHLRASVDKAGERRDATYYFAQNPVDARDCATARLVGSTQTTLHDLPSYPLCAEGIDAETERDLTYLQEAHGYQFRELSAMVKSSTGAHLGILEVIRALLHDTAETLRRLGDDPPDVIVEEVDDLAAKARIRRFAKAYGVPLVMATDLGDVTYLDVERHDLEDTPEFNGRIKQQDVDVLVNGEFTDAQRSRVLLKLAGLRHMSVRMLDSAVKRGSELAGIPQLGTTASAGGALATIAVRELLLGRRLKSGRYVISPKSVLGLQRQEGVVSAAGTIRRLRQELAAE